MIKVAVLFSAVASLTFGLAQGKDRTCRVLFPDAPDNAPKAIYLFNGEVNTKAELARMSFSPVYELPKGNLTLVASLQPLVAGEEIDPQLPRVNISENIGDIYLLFELDKSNSTLPLKMNVVPIDDSEFKPGELLWFNLSSASVAGTVGSQKLAIRPKSKKVMKAPSNRAGDYNVNIDYQEPETKKIYPVCDTVWSHTPDRRVVMFVTNGGKGSAPNIRGYSDFRMPEEEES